MEIGLKVSHQLADLSLNIQQPCAFNEHNISKHCFKEMMDVYASNVSITFEEISKIEKSTHGQSTSNKWFELRKYKITASNVYSAIVNSVEPSAKLKSMYYNTSFSSDSTNHGIVNERHVQNKYVENLKFNSINVYVKQLGGSLDGLVLSTKWRKMGIRNQVSFFKAWHEFKGSTGR